MLTTTLRQVPLVPEVSLHLAGGDVGLFDASGGEFRSDEPPPFWAFVWAGGQALARYVLDHPATVRGRRVLDLAAGSGIAGIAAALAGAASVAVADTDPAAGAAAARNAAANGVTIGSMTVSGATAGNATIDGGTGGGRPAGSATFLSGADGSGAAGGAWLPEVLLAGDAFYSARVADEMTARLRAARRQGTRVLVGDPGRGYFPERLFDRVAEYRVPVAPALEHTETLLTAVWEMRATMPSPTS